MGYKDEERKAYEEYTKIYSEYAPMLDKYKATNFELHKELCNFLEEKTGYYIQTQQYSNEKENGKKGDRYSVFFKIYFSDDNKNWKLVEVNYATSDEMYASFKLKVLLKKYIECIPPKPTDIDELIKIKWISEFDEKMIYSKEWFTNQLNQKEGLFNE